MQNDISHIWKRFNPRWLLTGILSGIGAGFVMLLLTSLWAHTLPREATFGAKLIGATLLGAKSLDLHSNKGAFVGLLIHFGLSSFFGLTFAQFVLEASRRRILILLSILGGLVSWLFWFMMFMPAFNEPMAWLFPKPISLLIHLVFGLTFGVLVVVLRPRLNANNE